MEKECVHLTSWPSEGKRDGELEIAMQQVRKIVELAHAKRKEAKIKVRQPLPEVRVQISEFRPSEELLELLKQELNVKKVTIASGKGEMRIILDTHITRELKAEGDARELVRKVQILRKEKGCRIDEKVNLTLPSEYQSLSKELLGNVAFETLAEKLTWGDELALTGSRE